MTLYRFIGPEGELREHGGRVLARRSPRGRLRSKVDDPFDQKLIHTVRGVGYVLEKRP